MERGAWHTNGCTRRLDPAWIGYEVLDYDDWTSTEVTTVMVEAETVGHRDPKSASTIPAMLMWVTLVIGRTRHVLTRRILVRTAGALSWKRLRVTQMWLGSSKLPRHEHDRETCIT